MSMFNSKNLKQLQSAYRKHQTQMRYQSVDNIFYQLCQANPTLGVIHHNKITLHASAWTKILKYVKDETGLDLAYDDVHALGQQDRLAVSTVMLDEKILAIAPTKGFIHVRLLGQTPSDSYIGIRADNLAEFGADNLIIIENFTPFVQMSHDHLARIGGLPTLARLCSSIVGMMKRRCIHTYLP